MIRHGAIGFFGKIPAHGDFVRANVGDPLVQRFTRWLEEASEASQRARAELPDSPVSFLFRGPGEARALVGALRASRDKVGRRFPLAVFVPADGPLVSETFPAVPLAYRAFVDAAAEALATEHAGAGALAERVAALPLPGPGDGARADEDARGAGARPAAEVLGRLLGDSARGGWHYAAHTFLSACATVRGREPARAEIVLDCPAADAADAWLWLELARRALRWPAAPPYLLRPGAPGRLLVSLGAPPATAALAAVGEPPRPGPRVWPLETALAGAAEAARGALGPARSAALERAGATLGDVVEELAGGVPR